MRVTYVAHACLLIESGGTRLLTDPWLDGPTYLSSWWQFPAPVLQGASLPPLDAVYLTHEHADHFHPATLALLPRSTPIWVGRFLRPRFLQRLRALGFSNVRELRHGEPVRLGPLELTSYQYRADDTALVISDEEATLLDLNDALHRKGALQQILDRHGPIDLLLASFANAEAYPVVYDLPVGERPDWDDQRRFDGFLDKVRVIGPNAFAPFASMFCFLSEELRGLNARIVSPSGLLARAGETGAVGWALDPGDVWTPRDGRERRSTVDWADKPRMIEAYAVRHAPQLASLAAAEVVPEGALPAAFASAFRAFWARAPWPLRRRLTLSVRWDLSAGTLWTRFDRGRLSLERPTNWDDWDLRLIVPDWVLWRVVTGHESWQSFGISCRFRAALQPGAREREVLFWMLLYLDDLGYLELGPLCTPRALGVLLRRRRELWEYAAGLVGGRFLQASLRDKFET